MDLIKENLEAVYAGNFDKHDSWSDLYQFHVANAPAILSFAAFRVKRERISLLLRADPHGYHSLLDDEIEKLCLELCLEINY